MAQADNLLKIAGDPLTRLVQQYLTTAELTELGKELIEAYGLGPYTNTDTEVLSTLESQLNRLYAKRLSAKSEGLTQSDVSILRPLSYCQTTLRHFAAAEASLATFVSQGEAEHGSLAAFFAVSGSSPGPNILFGQHYYYVLMENGNFARAEQVIAAYLPVIEAKFGRSDPRTLGGTRSMAIVLARLGRFEQAAAMDKETWQRIEEMEGANLQHKQDEIDAMLEESKIINELRGQAIAV